MGDRKILFDTEGGLVFLFLVAIWGFLIIILTYILWPKKPGKLDIPCKCQKCCEKRGRIAQKNKREIKQGKIKKLFMIAGWIILAILVYKATMSHIDSYIFDPFEILDVDESSDLSFIRKQYKKMSLKHHPDRPGGDETAFLKIRRAYEAITDETSREYWEKFGKIEDAESEQIPDGYALPAWFTEKENRFKVLGIYGVFLIVCFPIAVITWWNFENKKTNMIKSDSVKFLHHQLMQYPKMELERTLLILSGCIDFVDIFPLPQYEKKARSILQVKMLLRDLPKTGRTPYTFPFSVLTRIMLFAFLRRTTPPAELEIETDQELVISKYIVLINEAIKILQAVVGIHYSEDEVREEKERQQSLSNTNGSGNEKKGKKARNKDNPYKKVEERSLKTLLYFIQVSQLLAQAMEPGGNVFEQLPHITKHIVKDFTIEKRKLKSLTEMAMISEEDKEKILRNVTDDQYEDIITVLSHMPYVKIKANYVVLGNKEDTESFSTKSMISVYVTLERSMMKEIFNTKGEMMEMQRKSPSQSGRWKTKREKKKKQRKKQNTKQRKKGNKVQKAVLLDANNDEVEDKKDNDTKEDVDEEYDYEEEDKLWEKHQKEIKADNSFNTDVKNSHPVHCPYIREEREEGWWLFISEEKKQRLMTSPQHIVTLKDKQEVSLRLKAPKTPGSYIMRVNLVSDCYFKMSYYTDKKMKVSKLEEDELLCDMIDDGDDDEEDDDDNESSDTTDNGDSDDSEYDS